MNRLMNGLFQKMVLLAALGCTAPAFADAGHKAGWPPPMHKPGPFWMVAGERLEWRGGSDAGYDWGIQGWYGGDFNRFRWKTEGAGAEGRDPGEAEVQALFSRLYSPYWEWQAGIRHQLEPADGDTWLAVGLQGVAPYEFEVETSLFLAGDGKLAFRAEAAYDLLLTQRLVLQPRGEVEAALAGHVEHGIDEAELGLRLRYEIRREFAPYIGVAWTYEDHGSGEAGESDVQAVLGLRFWF